MAERKSFTMKYTAVGTGTDYALLRDWVSREYIKPETKSEGQGQPNIFTKQNLYQVRLFASLVESGCTRGEASAIVDDFTVFNPSKPYLCIHTVDQETKIDWMTEKQVQALKYDRMTVINVGALVAEVDLNVINL
jgi:hypothetical protein